MNFFDLNALNLNALKFKRFRRPFGALCVCIGITAVAVAADTGRDELNGDAVNRDELIGVAVNRDHLFVLSGQSNMNGLKPEQTLQPILEKRFGADHVVIVKDSHGGQSISRWDQQWQRRDKDPDTPVGDLYGKLISKVTGLVGERRFRSVNFLWMQGEKDARLGNADVYRASFERLVEQLKRDLKVGDINIVVGRLSDFGNDNEAYPDWMAMRNVLQTIGDTTPRTRWVNTDDLNDGLNGRGKAIQDDLHYSVKGYRTFGQRMANAAIALIEKFDVPYDSPPPIAPPYHRVRYPAPHDAESTQNAGSTRDAEQTRDAESTRNAELTQNAESTRDAESTRGRRSELAYAVRYTVWVPPDVSKLRGVIVHQHGCGVGSCRSGLTGAHDLHWQSLAAAHDCALLAASYEQPDGTDCGLWCDPRNGSEQTFLRALNDLGDACGHPELSEVPWALWGHSGGGTWVGSMLCLHPDRVAAAWLQSGTPTLEPLEHRDDARIIDLPSAAASVPVMLCLGTEEGVTQTSGRFAGVYPRMRKMHATLRQMNAPAAIAIDPLTGHACGNQRYLAVVWFDACLSHRLPEQSGDAMSTMPDAIAWLAEPGQTVAVAADRFAGDPASAHWLPGKSVATAWTEFVTASGVTDSTPPPPPTGVTVESGRLVWRPVADPQSGVRQCVITRDGVEVARVPDKPSNPRGRKVAQGLQYSDTPVQPLVKFEYPLGPDAAGHRYGVATVNTVGESSPPVELEVR